MGLGLFWDGMASDNWTNKWEPRYNFAHLVDGVHKCRWSSLELVSKASATSTSIITPQNVLYPRLKVKMTNFHQKNARWMMRTLPCLNRWTLVGFVAVCIEKDVHDNRRINEREIEPLFLVFGFIMYIRCPPARGSWLGLLVPLPRRGLFVIYAQAFQMGPPVH